ncbi:pyrroloquinoline quinone biosynthesis peptide chaperone PqqD [Streptomyces barringtoniae]|uniref:pyrroloquinoline quinone biosynthesis peptide chaperone PqqD n=1 Tax=Streptomyces barringtoniae TaxID=2892029 RepID=UPI003556F9DC
MTAASPASPAMSWRPVLARGVVLRHDRVRGTDLLLLPERVVVLDGSAGGVLRLCDGVRDVAAVVTELAVRHPAAPVAAEVPEFLNRLRKEGWLR